jgi:hypothetical protein
MADAALVALLANDPGQQPDTTNTCLHPNSAAINAVQL